MRAWGREIRAAIVAATTNCLNVSGRASVYEYWNWLLVCLVVGLLFVIPGIPRLTGFVWTVLAEVSIFTAGVRRLHDSGRSGYWVLVGYIPLLIGEAANAVLDLSESTSVYVGGATALPWLYLFYLLTRPGDEAPNDFGPPPRQTLALLRRLRERQDSA